MTPTPSPPPPISPRRLLAPLPTPLFLGPAVGQDQEPKPPIPNQVVTATFEGAAPKAPFKFKWKEKNGSFTKNVGLLHWQMPPDEPAKAGMAGVDGYFRTYCAEALVGVVGGKTYKFEVQRPEHPEGYGLPNTEEGQAQAARRATYVRELFGRYYPASIRGDDVDAPLAFQVALWEIIGESQLPEAAAAPFSLFTGNFQADYPTVKESPAFV